MPLSTKCFYVIVILVMFWLPVNFSIDAFQESLENRLLTIGFYCVLRRYWFFFWHFVHLGITFPFFYWKLLYTIAYKVIKNEYIGWMFFCWDTQQDRKIFPAVGFAFRIVKDNIAISYTFVTLHRTLPMI